MLTLKAADQKDQKELDEAIKKFEKFFLLLEADFAGERSNAATHMKASLVTINKLQGKTFGQSGYFGLHDILQGADSSGVTQELERAKELIREFETNNKNLALAERCLRDEVARLQEESDRLRSMPVAGHDAGRVKPSKEFLVGALGISVVLTFLLAGLLGFYSWANVFLSSAVAMTILPLGMRFIGGFCLKAGDEVQYRIALCADWAIAGVKAIAFSFIMLFLSGIAGGLLGAGSLWGADLPAEISGEGLVQWMAAAAAELFGMLFLAAGVGLFFVIRWRARDWNLPGPLESLFS